MEQCPKHTKEFLEAVEFGDLTALNKVSHPSLDNRKIEILKLLENSNESNDERELLEKELNDITINRQRKVGGKY